MHMTVGMKTNLQVIFPPKSASCSVPTIISVFQVNFCLPDEVVHAYQIPVIHLYSQQGLHWECSLNLKAPGNKHRMHL